MDKPTSSADLYLRDLSTQVTGSRRTRTRLLAELRDHLDDAVAAGIDAGLEATEAEEQAIEKLGSSDALTRAWEARRSRLRRRRRGRIAMLVGAAAVASALGVAQHADGRRAPIRSCSGGSVVATGRGCSYDVASPASLSPR